jgi:hypothetical protein
MRWYLTGRRWIWPFGAAAILIPLSGLLGTASVPIPRPGGGLDAIPLIVIAPGLVAWLVLWSLSSGLPAHESTAARAVHRYDLVAVASLISIQALVAVTLSPWYSVDDSFMVVRNTTGYVATAIVVTRLVSPMIAAAVVAVLPVACAVFGSRVGPLGREISWWAWPLQPATSELAVILVATFGIAAAALLGSPGRRRLPAR